MGTSPSPVDPEDFTAIIYANGTRKWYQNGHRRRDNDLPVVIRTNGTQIWYKNILLHRDNDLPAIIHPGGKREWYCDGKRHRDDDLPAVIHADGKREWYCDGKRHRDLYPAVIYPPGLGKEPEWWISGVKQENGELEPNCRTKSSRNH